MSQASPRQAKIDEMRLPSLRGRFVQAYWFHIRNVVGKDIPTDSKIFGVWYILRALSRAFFGTSTDHLQRTSALISRTMTTIQGMNLGFMTSININKIYFYFESTILDIDWGKNSLWFVPRVSNMAKVPTTVVQLRLLDGFPSLAKWQAIKPFPPMPTQR